MYFVGFYAPKSFESVGEALSFPLRRSRLGSLSEGAGSPNGLTEGVYLLIAVAYGFLRTGRGGS